MKSQELCALLIRDRAHEKTTTRQQIAYRMQAETVVGQDENLYKVEFVSTAFIF
jgi:paired amphipathic helix protein Sin3a